MPMRKPTRVASSAEPPPNSTVVPGWPTIPATDRAVPGWLVVTSGGSVTPRSQAARTSPVAQNDWLLVVRVGASVKTAGYAGAVFPGTGCSDGVPDGSSADWPYV